MFLMSDYEKTKVVFNGKSATDIYDSIKFALTEENKILFIPDRNKFIKTLVEIGILKMKPNGGSRKSVPSNLSLELGYMKFEKIGQFQTGVYTRKGKEFILNNINSIVNDKYFEI